MDSNKHSTQAPEFPGLPEPPGPLEPLELAEPPEPPEGLAPLVAVLDDLADEDLERLPVTVRAQRALALEQLADRLVGQWLKELAGVDALGAAGADQGEAMLSTASWLRARLHMSSSTAHDTVRTARALFRGPLPQTAQALTNGQISPAHARVLAQGTRHLPDQTARAAEPVLLEAARHLDPPKLRQAVGYLLEVADPDAADVARQRRHERRGLWVTPTLDGMVAVDGLLEPEAGATVMAALEPLARPADADDDRLGGQRTADALVEVCRRSLEAGWLPKVGGVRPQLLVTMDLDSLLGHPGSSGGVGGDLGWAGPLEAEACRRLTCDGTVTRVVVSRHLGPGPAANLDAAADLGPSNHAATADHDPSGDADPSAEVQLQRRLHAALTLLPPTLGGAPSQPLDVGRATRVITPAQRAALAVRDRGCVFPGCERPLAWCDGHHLWHWIDGGPTDLGNLALLCRAHHRAVHEGGWRLTAGPDGRWTASPGPPAGRGHRQRPPPTATRPSRNPRAR
jgi:uncharacterized protein DUF222/HNH endonuclease